MTTYLLEHYLIFGFVSQTNIWNGGTVGRSVKMMFSSKAEERVDKKDMVSNVFMCRILYFCVFVFIVFCFFFL